jgi:hypothetical protein
LSVETLGVEMLWVSQGRKEKRDARRIRSTRERRGGGRSIKRKRKKVDGSGKVESCFSTRGKARAAETEQDRYRAIQMSLHGKAKYLTLALVRGAKPSYPG